MQSIEAEFIIPCSNVLNNYVVYCIIFCNYRIIKYNDYIKDAFII